MRASPMGMKENGDLLEDGFSCSHTPWAEGAANFKLTVAHVAPFPRDSSCKIVPFSALEL